MGQNESRRNERDEARRWGRRMNDRVGISVALCIYSSTIVSSLAYVLSVVFLMSEQVRRG